MSVQADKRLSAARLAVLAQPWPSAGLSLAGGLVGLLVMFWATAAATAETWYQSATYGHGFLVLPVVAILLWRERKRLAELVPRPSPWGLLVVALAAAAWRLGELNATLLIQQLALVAMAQGLWLLVLGWHATRLFVFPLGYLYFAVPLGSSLIEPLQKATALLTVWMLQLTGIPVHLDGVWIELPTESFHIAEACSGLRFLITALAIGTLGAYLLCRRWSGRLLLVALSLALPLAANAGRTYALVLSTYLGHFLFGVRDHTVYGLVLLGLMLSAVLIPAFLLRDRGPALPSPVSAGTRSRAGSTVVFPLAAAAALTVAAMTAFAGVADAPQLAQGEAVRLSSPAVQSPWFPSQASATAWRPVFVGADAELLRSYESGERRVDLYLAYFGSTRQGAEVVNDVNNLVGGNAMVVERGRASAYLQGTPVTVQTVRLAPSTSGRMIWHWYWIDGRFTSRPVIAKLLQAKAALLGGNEASAAIAVAADYVRVPAEAHATIDDFLRHLELEAFLERLSRPQDHSGRPEGTG